MAPPATTCSSKSPEQAMEIGFAINVDGVLTHKFKLLSFAREALVFLNSHHYPFFLFVDGIRAQTGEEASAELQTATDISVGPDKFVFPTRTFKNLIAQIPGFASQNILVIGHPTERITQIAKDYGYQHVYPSANVRQHPNLKIDAILVFNTPEDWDADLQLVLDLFLSRAGYMYTKSVLNGLPELPNRGYGQDGQPSIHWADMKLSRKNGSMTFDKAVETAWKKHTDGAELQGSWTERMLPFVERELFPDLQAPKKRIAYLIEGASASIPLSKLDARTRYGVDWKGILIITESKRRKYSQPIAHVPNIGAGMFWAFEHAGLRTTCSEISRIAGFPVPRTMLLSQPDVSSSMRKGTSIATLDLNKPLPALPTAKVFEDHTIARPLRQPASQNSERHIKLKHKSTIPTPYKMQQSSSDENSGAFFRPLNINKTKTAPLPERCYVTERSTERIPLLPRRSSRRPMSPSQTNDLGQSHHDRVCVNLQYAQYMATQSVKYAETSKDRGEPSDWNIECSEYNNEPFDGILKKRSRRTYGHRQQDDNSLTESVTHDPHLAKVKDLHKSKDCIRDAVRDNTRKRLKDANTYPDEF